MGSFLKLVVCLALAGWGLVPTATAQRDSLRCSSQGIGPFLDFEFRFAAGAWFSLPLKQFWGGHVKLDFAMEVEPVDGTPGEMLLIENELRGKERIPDGLGGDITFTGAVSVGPGKYRIQWTIGDSYGRSCEGVRRFMASLSRRER